MKNDTYNIKYKNLSFFVKHDPKQGNNLFLKSLKFIKQL